MYGSYDYEPICGLYYNVPYFGRIQQAYLPQVEVKVHASILATTSRTTLKQTFVNPSASRGIREVRYAFPLYDGVSVVGFSCQVGNRTITGEVREKQEAKEVYSDAVARGETAGLLEQLPEASDVFTTTIGNIPPGARVVVNVTYLGELKHDMEVDGTRFTIPTKICPRYGTVNGGHFDSVQQMNGTISITVDAEMAEGSFIQKLQSPSHPISMSMGTTSVEPDAGPSMSKASATLSLGVAHLDTDFVLQVIAKETGVPKAILETHSTIPNHRALMTTLVPKFALPTEKPEIVFVCDQSGSMGGSRMDLAIEALQVFLKSLPVGVKFNICSFGSRHSFLWPRSVTYSQDTLDHAVRHTRGISANYGGTEMLAPLKATIENRYSDMPLDIMLLTDGETWNQRLLFDELNYHIQEKKAPIRVFTLGIGSGVSHSLIEGIAKAGNGFAQTVQEGEKMSSKVVRMLKGALSPHVNDYTLEVKYASGEEEDGFELVEKVTDSLRVNLDLKDKRNVPKTKKSQNPISLFDTSADLDAPAATSKDRYAHLPIVPAPKILQAPQSIPPLFAFNRTTVYLLLSPSAPRATPTSVILRGTSAHGPLELEIPIQTLDAPGETIHQLAAKKAVSELEQGRGWLAEARDREGELLKKRFEGRFSDMVEHEAVKLGVQFQVGGKWCSFVATEKKEKESRETMEEDWEFLEDVQGAQQEQEQEQQHMANARVFAQQQRAQQQQAQQQQFIPQGLQASPVRSPRSFPYGSAGSFSPLQTHDNSDSGGFSTFSAKPAVSTSSSGGGLFGGALSTMKTATLFGQSSTSASSNPFARGFGASNSKVQPAAASLFGSGSVSTTAYAGGSLFGTAASASAASASVPISASHASALQDYQMQTMLLEQQNKKRLHMRQKPTTAEQTRTNKLKRAAFECERPVGDGSDAVLENSDFDAFLHTDKSSTQRAVKQVAAKKKRSQPLQRNQLIDVPQSGGIEEIEEQPKMPTSPSYSPHNHGYTTCSPLPQSTSPPLGAPSPDYTPYSPGYRSPGTAEPQSPGYSPISPRYSPTSPSPYSPSCAVDPQSPQSPQYAAASPSYGPGLIDFSPLTPLSSEAMLKRLVAHQSFSGAFPYSIDILAVLGVDVQAFEKSMEEQEWHDASADRDPLMTALVIIHVESKLKELRDEWELVIEKARIWLQSRERAAAVYLEVAEKLVQGE